uniref:RNA polymerase alpha subunit n=1 Tax=Partenskyella glossopodia TaxID=552666 RepID=A0A140JZM3_9EUKA|nr:RNA polymerase alpha subunit [Partenskyella glossopodia]BAU62550.1 RNA polymerase alpha subunit [Partenskyella glossopodia]
MEYMLFSCIESRIKNDGSCYSRFQIGPFFKDQAIIYSNTLRRILLSDISNITIIGVNIIGINHEYAFLDGAKESILDLLLNLKQVVFIKNIYTLENVNYFAYLRSFGPKIIKAKNIILPNILRCINNNQYLGTLSSNGKLIMKIHLVNQFPNLFSLLGNFSPNSLLSFYTSFNLINTQFPIILDSNFSCVNKVNYNVNFSDRLENSFDSMFLEIWTNGALLPCVAIQNSLKNIINLFFSIYDISSNNILLDDSNLLLESYIKSIVSKASFLKINFFNSCSDICYHNSLCSKQNLFVNKNIDCLDIPLYSKYLLKKDNIFTFEDLTKIKKSDLMLNYNFSKKSLRYLEKNMLIYNLCIKS